MEPGGPLVNFRSVNLGGQVRDMQECGQEVSELSEISSYLSYLSYLAILAILAM
jgi:hypothetical protein